MLTRTALGLFLGAVIVPGVPAFADVVNSSIPIPTAPVPGGSTQFIPGLAALPKPTIVVGSPLIPDNPTAFSAINQNSPDSPLAGVVSIYGAATTSNGFLGSGVVLDSTHVLTAAHVVDFFGGVTPEGATTGDGQADALMPYSRVYLNNIAAPDPIGIQSVQLAPGWNGFRNVNSPAGAGGATDHNDLAILTLSSPIPASVPRYPIYHTPFDQDTAKVILMAGYGNGGDEVNGITQPASFDIKRYGWNVAAVYETSSKPGSSTAELYLADFDPSDANGNPDPTQGGFDGYTSVGNDFEATIAPGDSGGAAFLVDDINGDGIVEPDELTLFGLTTFIFDTGAGAWPSYGSGFGGPILSAYTDFIDSALGVPEPASLTLLSLGSLILLRRGRGQSSRSRP